MSNENSVLNTMKIRPLSIDDFKTVLNWSQDDSFCSANGWETNRSEEELYRWWVHCVSHESEDFIRLGIELEERFVRKES